MSFSITEKNRGPVVALGIIALLAIALIATLIGTGTLHSRMKAASLPTPIDQRSGLDCAIDAGLGNQFSPNALNKCDKINFPHRPVILFVGDSHAGSLNDGMSAFAENNRLNLMTFTALYCTPLSQNDRRPACREFNRYIERKITEIKPDLIVLAANHIFWNDNEGYAETLPYQKFITSKLKELREITHKEVLLVGQNPTWQISLTRVLNIAFLAKGREVPERTFEGMSEDSLQWDKILRDEALAHKVPYFSIKDEICNEDGCRVRVGNNLQSDLMEFDYGHLSHQGSLYVVNHGLGKTINDLLKASSEKN